MCAPTQPGLLMEGLWGELGRCCVKGSLLEVNQRLADHPALLHTKVGRNSRGWT